MLGRPAAPLLAAVVLVGGMVSGPACGAEQAPWSRVRGQQGNAALPPGVSLPAGLTCSESLQMPPARTLLVCRQGTDAHPVMGLFAVDGQKVKPVVRWQGAYVAHLSGFAAAAPADGCGRAGKAACAVQLVDLSDETCMGTLVFWADAAGAWHKAGLIREVQVKGGETACLADSAEVQPQADAVVLRFHGEVARPTADGHFKALVGGPLRYRLEANGSLRAQNSAARSPR